MIELRTNDRVLSVQDGRFSYKLNGANLCWNRIGFTVGASHGTGLAGVFADISEEKLLKTARCVAANMPDVKHFLIDGAWQNSLIDPVICPTTAKFHLPEGQWHNPEKFPRGMKVMADMDRGPTPCGVRTTMPSPGMRCVGVGVEDVVAGADLFAPSVAEIPLHLLLP